MAGYYVTIKRQPFPMAATLCAAHWRPLARGIPEVEELAGRKIDRDGSVVLNSSFFFIYSNNLQSD